MKPKSKRIMGLLLALVMILGCIPLNSMEVYAADVYPVEINNVNFPDDDFRSIVVEWGDTNHDGWLSKEEAGIPTSINNYSGKAPVKDLKGLEYFYNAKEILFKNAKLTNVDLSKNPNLEKVILDGNQITKIDISNNLKLKELSIKGNKIDKLSNIKFGYNNALETLNLSENYFTKLDLRRFPNLKKLECSGQKSNSKLTELLMQSKKLEYLDCSKNYLTDLDLTKSTELTVLICNDNCLTSLDFSNSQKIDIYNSDNRDQYYAIGVDFPYPCSKLPGNFNPSYVSNLEGATISGGAFYLQNEDTKEITYDYKPTGSKASTSVTLGVNGFLSIKEVHNLDSKAQDYYKRLTFDAGDGEIDGKQKKALDVSDFTTFDVPELLVQIKRMQPIANDPNKTFLNWFPEIPQGGEVGAATETYYTARYTDKVKVSTDPNAGLLDGYTRIAFDAGEGNTVDGSRYKVIDVVTGTKWNDPILQSKLPQKVVCVDKTKEFQTWSQEILNDDSVVGTGLFEARYTLKDTVKTGTDPNAQTPEGYTRIIFDAGEGNTVEGSRYKVIDVREDLTWSHSKVASEAPTEAKYKDSTRVFDKWNPEVPISTKKVEKQTFTAVYKDKVFDPEHVEKMVVKTQPKLIYTEGEKLDLTSLEVTLTDNQKLTKDVAFKDFADNGIKAEPANETSLTVAANNGKTVKLTKGSLTAQTNTLTVKEKEIVKTGTDPNTQVPKGYTRITFDAGEGNTINGTNRYKVIDVLTGTAWDNKAVKDEIPEKAKYKDATKIFTEWDSTVPTTGPVEEQDFTAIYRTPAPTPTPTDPIVGPVDPSEKTNPDPDTTWTVTFAADAAKGTIAKENTFYVLRTANKTLADLRAPEVTAKTGFKVTGWDKGLDTVINDNITVNATFEEVTTPPTPTPAPTPEPRPYWPDYREEERPYRPYRPHRRNDDKKETKPALEEKVQETSKYDKFEAVLFIKDSIMQKSVNGVVSQVRMDIAPFIYQSRTMLPIRFVAEALGFTVTWDAKTKTVYLSDKENIIQIPVETNNIIVNGNTFVSDVKPMIKNNRTMLPVANVARALGLVDGKDILWDAVRAMVTLKRNVLK